MSMKKTKFYDKEEGKWVLIDAKDKILGRLSVKIAKILTGKNSPRFTPNAICGDKVVVINAKYIRVTGNKLEDKFYTKFSGYPGGDSKINLQDLSKKNPCVVLRHAIKGMVPKNWLGKQMLRSLKIYPEGTHEQAAQVPQPIEV